MNGRNGSISCAWVAPRAVPSSFASPPAQTDHWPVWPVFASRQPVKCLLVSPGESRRSLRLPHRSTNARAVACCGWRAHQTHHSPIRASSSRRIVHERFRRRGSASAVSTPVDRAADLSTDEMIAKLAYLTVDDPPTDTHRVRRPYFVERTVRSNSSEERGPPGLLGQVVAALGRSPQAAPLCSCLHRFKAFPAVPRSVRRNRCRD